MKVKAMTADVELQPKGCRAQCAGGHRRYSDLLLGDTHGTNRRLAAGSHR